MAEKRKSIPKKTRFEVFKRDNFTCQYCGKSAPDIILEIDHINPVNSGGDNSILNLVTSCRDCNRGKGKRKLNDNSEITKQRKQLEEINEKRNQLEMMLKWKEELSNFENEQMDIINGLIKDLTGYALTQYGKNIIRKAIKEFGFFEVLDSFEISFEQYFNENNIIESSEKVIDYIPKICFTRKRQMKDRRYYYFNYLKKVMNNTYPFFDDFKLKEIVFTHIDTDEKFETIKTFMFQCRSWKDFVNTCKEYFYIN